MTETPLLFDLGSRPPTTRTIALTVKQGGAAALDRGPAPGRRGAISGSHLPIGSESREGHAVQLDAEPVSRLHARLPLLLRPALPDAVRAGTRRRVLVADLRQAELRGCAAAGARQAVVDARAGRGRHGDRSLPADRRPLQADAAVARSAGRGTDADRLDHQGADGRARRRRARRSLQALRLSRLR